MVACTIATATIGSLTDARPTEVVACWGLNSHAQCNVPTDLGSCSQIVAGRFHTVALKDNGAIRCWGSNEFSQCTPPIGSSPSSLIAAGWFHTLSLSDQGVARAWGRNQSGQCDVPLNLGPCIGIAGGAEHSLALRANGTIVGWGSNEFGQISIPPTLGPCTAIAAGGYHSVALTTTGKVVCWGRFESATTGSQRAANFLRDLRDNIDSVDILTIGDSNTGYSDLPAVPISGWTDGLGLALSERGNTQYATPLQPIEPPATSFGITSINVPMPAGVVGEGNSLALNLSGNVNAPIALVNLLTANPTTNGTGIYPTGLPFNFAWVPQQSNRFYNSISGILINENSPLNIRSELIYRVLRSSIPQSNQPGNYFQNWTTLAGSQLVQPTLRQVAASTYGWIADELTLPADPNRPLDTLHATCAGGFLGQGFGVRGNCALGLQSVYRRVRGWSSQPLNYHGGATMTQIAQDISQMPLASRMTWLNELVSRQLAAGGSGRLLVFIQGGVNQDQNLPQSWRDAIVNIKSALESTWSALGRDPNAITFVAMVSHPVPAVEAELSALRAYANTLPSTIDNLTIIDLAKLTDSTEMMFKQWYSVGGHLHLSGQGYWKIAVRMIDSLLGQNSPIVTPADCQVTGSCVKIAAGSAFTVALKSNGSVRSWGSPLGGAVDVSPTLTGCTDIAAGDIHNIALQQDQRIVQWGSNLYQQCSPPPNLANFTRIAASGFHTVAIATQTFVCNGDWNGDGMRDGIDLSAILAGWGTASADINGDGTTDGADLSYLLSGWGPCP